MSEFPFYLAGKRVRSDKPIDVRNPYGSTVGRTWRAGDSACDAAANAAVSAAPPTGALAAFERADILTRVADSGLGREGPRYTIEEMTEPRLLVINRQLA